MSFSVVNVQPGTIDTVLNLLGSHNGKEKRHNLLRERYQSRTDKKHLVTPVREKVQAQDSREICLPLEAVSVQRKLHQSQE
jgi:hypothetical protein